MIKDMAVPWLKADGDKAIEALSKGSEHVFDLINLDEDMWNLCELVIHSYAHEMKVGIPPKEQLELEKQGVSMMLELNNVTKRME